MTWCHNKSPRQSCLCREAGGGFGSAHRKSDRVKTRCITGKRQPFSNGKKPPQGVTGAKATVSKHCTWDPYSPIQGHPETRFLQNTTVKNQPTRLKTERLRAIMTWCHNKSLRQICPCRETGGGFGSAHTKSDHVKTRCITGKRHPFSDG